MPEWVIHSLVYLRDSILPNFTGSVAGAFLGALFAFKYNLKQLKLIEVEKKIEAGNFSSFTMIQQLNSLVTLERALHSYRYGNMRGKAWLELQPMYQFGSVTLLQPESLNWLLRAGDPNLLPRMLAAENGLMTVKGLVEKRIEIKQRVNEHIQNVLASTVITYAVVEDGCLSLDTINKILSDKDKVELSTSSDQLFTHIAYAINEYFEVLAELDQTLRKLWPKERFVRIEKRQTMEQRIGFSLPEKPQDL